MLIRVRSNVGVWRVDGLDAETATVTDVLAGIARSRPHVVYERPLARDPACHETLSTTETLRAQGLDQNGAMIHCRVDPTTCADWTAPAAEMSPSTMTGNATVEPKEQGQHFRRVIDKDGGIKLVPTKDVPTQQDRGFRKGMLPLRDMKMSWTLNDFIALDSQFEFKIQRQEKATTSKVSLDVPSISNFQTYLQRFQFQRKRCGFLYGKFVKEDESDEKPTKVLVEAIYEPPQEINPDSAEGFTLEDDPQEEEVNQLAEWLGLQRVGWVFGHAPRQGYVLSAAETILAAEFQLEAAGGVEETPFCTVTVAPKLDGQVAVEAFQVSQQCMAMVAEEALQVDPDNPQLCKVNETFTAIQEGKASPTVETAFFLTVVPIVQHTSETFVADFPRANRDLDDTAPNKDALTRQLRQAGSNGWTLVDRLADFNLLIYLKSSFDFQSDFPKICAAIANRDIPLDDGYKLLIASLAGLDGAY
ncbi:predicted protein [Phaeodactylum tricornutum CCAP 1055/1]|jgi:nuclear protein localization family protein 4|uniref:MPN domain-containing protein n=2 Tax=Phaeodactylum tricornutum TaxID=2850 RepID=B5Y563_PHATC|nr:predicted protein [Phaeodactylum tricornutum CCAP 1055/1]ACI65885.1 predicted protein [Phaeodactylum tricornutum CCAP 1055/1]|eukprot:XP_002186415.1 predicted protein [Phaeodactylum tricornutum CCAP 1055/1]